MVYTVDMSQNKAINWAAKGAERIFQNVVNLLSTRKYEIAFDRTLGLSGKFVDRPLDQAIAEATTEIFELVPRREPRASVKEVELVGVDQKGNLQFKVVIEIG